MSQASSFGQACDSHKTATLLQFNLCNEWRIVEFWISGAVAQDFECSFSYSEAPFLRLNIPLGTWS
jgi:hypothetical protein